MPDYYPDIISTQVVFKRLSNTQTFQSPFSRAVQSVSFSGSLWGATITHEHLNKVEYNQLYGFLVGLRGKAGRFYLSPPQYDVTLPTGLTASTTGTSLVLSGAASDLDVGAYVSINHNLRMITAKASDTSFTVDTPFLTDYVSTAIELNNPDCLMMLQSDDLEMSFQGKYFSNVTVDCVEAIT